MRVDARKSITRAVGVFLSLVSISRRRRPWICAWPILLGSACQPINHVERVTIAPTPKPIKHAEPKRPPADLIRPPTVSLPGITLDLDTREVRIEGQVCITSGVLEYVAVAAGGKEYESIFSLNCRPSHLQVVLLMAGYDAGEVLPASRGDYAPNADTDASDPPEGAPQATEPPDAYWTRPQGEPTAVTLDVEIEETDGEWLRHPVTDFLLDRRTRAAPENLTWAFTGSFFYRDPHSGLEAYIGDLEKSLIALWYDPSALFNLFQDVGNPYRGDAVGLEVDTDALPAKGTPVRVVIRPVAAGE